MKIMQGKPLVLQPESHLPSCCHSQPRVVAHVHQHRISPCWSMSVLSTPSKIGSFYHLLSMTLSFKACFSVVSVAIGSPEPGEMLRPEATRSRPWNRSADFYVRGLQFSLTYCEVENELEDPPWVCKSSMSCGANPEPMPSYDLGMVFTTHENIGDCV